MASRRHIRETAVQLLYCAHLRGGSAPADLRERFWRIVTEPDRRQLATATLRCIQHFGQARPAQFADWLARLPDARSAIAADPQAAALGDALAQTETAETSLTTAFDALLRLPLDGSDDEIGPGLDQALTRFGTAAATAAAARRHFLTLAEDFPHLTPVLDPLTAPLRRFDRAAERIDQLRHPEQLPERQEFEQLRQAHALLDGLREGAEQFLDSVLGRLDEIDAKLAAIIDNFAPERIDPVDRSVLRLAAWEILFDPTVPAAVAINEAVEIARRFGTSDSARFVNGILDRLAKEAA